MTDTNRTGKVKHRDKYEPPQAIRLNDTDRAFGTCSPTGSAAALTGYRVHEYTGNCVTGKSATVNCHGGASGSS